MTLVSRTCRNPKCRDGFKARQADLDRGWGLYCSKRCKAVVQESKTHQHRNYLRRRDGTSKEGVHVDMSEEGVQGPV